MTRHARKHVSSLIRDERGFTLVELLAAIPLMLMIFFATFQLYEVAVREQDRDDARVRSIVQQKNGLEKISRELRDSVALEYQTSDIMDAQISSGGPWVHYDCSGTTCRRWQGATQGALTTGPVTIVSNVLSAEFHTYSNSSGSLIPDYVNPTYVTVTLRVTAKGASNPIVLNDGFNLRNLTTPG
jgi:Tfp pilus assembly protein PilW